MQAIKYRPDIDGLRAIAVLAVVLYHTHSQWLPGGFVGVDIFFVISGFLITSIINTENSQGSFSFSQFYQRRIKRILPLFFSVILTTLIISYFLFSPREYVDFAKSARYAIGFMTNHYFAQEQDYFAPNAEEIPLLHMWSLAVEEQYYFLWPSLFLLIHKKLPKYILPITFSLAGGSFVLASLWALQPELASQAYYLLPSRFGELMIGSMMALNVRPSNNRLIANLCSCIGMFLISASCIFLTKNSVFPGYNALWPCIGTALIIYSGTHSQLPFINRCLTNPVVVFIGLLSYSIYLWHWPILAYARYYSMTTELSSTWIIFCLSSTFVLSYLSWRFIEKPARQQKIGFRVSAIKFFIIPSMILLMLCLAIKQTGGYLLRDKSEGFDTIESPSLICYNDLKKDCHLGKQDQPAKTLIIGDSHTAHLTTFFDLLGQKHDWASNILSVGSCPPLTKTDLLSISSEKQRLRCQNLIKRVSATIDDYDTVIYSLRWDLHFGYNRYPNYSPSLNFRSQLEYDIESLLEKDKMVFIVGQVPLYKHNVSRSHRTSSRENTLDLSYEKSNAILQDIVSQYPGVHYIDTASILLNWHNGMINGLPAYLDEDHLNVYGQKMLANDSEKFLWVSDIIKRK